MILQEALDLEVISMYIILESIKVMQNKKKRDGLVQVEKEATKGSGFSSFLLSHGPYSINCPTLFLLVLLTSPLLLILPTGN